jgi:hypothetical protein
MRASSRPRSNWGACGSRLSVRPGAWRVRSVGGGPEPVGHSVQVRLERPIAFDDALLVRVVEVDFLLQHEEQVGLPRALEAPGDLVPGRANAAVAEGGQRRRIPLALQDGAHDRLAGAPAEIA